MRYRIKHIDEEFFCPNCGEPSFVGDTAWEEPGDNCYCSAWCAGYRPSHLPIDRILISPTDER